MLRSHVLRQTLNANQKQMCMKHTLLINTHLIVYRIMNWKNKHAHSDICYWQPENVEDTPHVYTYIHRSAMHTCMHRPTNQPRSVAQTKKTSKKKINMNSSLSPSLSVHKKTAYTPRWPQSAHGNVEVNGGCHYAKFGRLCIHSLQEKGNINI